MEDIRFYRNGDLIDSPRNWKSTEFSWEWQNNKAEASINMDNIEFVGEEAARLTQRVLNGMSGGVGIFEGEPMRIEVGEVGDPDIVFEGYLDFADETTFMAPNVFRTSLKKKQGTDWLNDVADGISFRYLYEIGHITQPMFVKIPYVLNFKPDRGEILILSITIFTVTSELYRLIKDIATAIAEIINSVTPSVGFGVVWDIGDVIWVVLNTIGRIVFGVLIVITLKNLIETFIEELVPKKRFHKGITFLNLMERAVSYFGYQLQSGLLVSISDWVFMPRKTHTGGIPPTGFPELGVPTLDGAFDKIGDFIRWMKIILQADFVIDGNTFIFEHETYFEDTASYVLPNVWDDQERQFDVFSPNTQEFTSNYTISWAYDVLDRNTTENVEGLVVQSITEPIVVGDPAYKNMKGSEFMQFPLSLGLRKESLNRVENVLKVLAGIIDTITGMFGGSSNFVSKIEDRKHTLLLSEHTTTNPKVIKMQGNKLAPNQRIQLSARAILDTYHFHNFFFEKNGRHNQWLRHRGIKIPLSKQNCKKILQNPFCFTHDGKKARIDSLKWNAYSNTAEIDYRVNEKYTLNLKEKILI